MYQTKSTERLSNGMQSLESLSTPCLVLDLDRMKRNVDRLRSRMRRMGVSLRPHLKTGKSVNVAHHLMSSKEGPAAVSTLAEAEHFASAGVRDLIYAVGIAPAKLTRVVALHRQDVDIVVILDSIEQAAAVAEESVRSGIRIPALIEIDCDGQRAGIRASEAERIVAIGERLNKSADLRGVLVHAGGSYSSKNRDDLTRWAETERRSAVQAASHLKASGLPSDVVSVGSTPTAHFATNLEGVTEVRAGVFVFFDLVQAGLGVCDIDDIALSVLATVIGVQRQQRRILVDAGWMALSNDRSSQHQKVDQGYGLVCDILGNVLPDLIVSSANQEHGVLTLRSGSEHSFPALTLGDRIRIFPNHACAMAAQHTNYHVVRTGSLEIEDVWPRFRGW